MTFKVLIIGNSHLASVKTGWEQIKEQFSNRAQCYFLGARRDRVANIQIENGRLYSNDDDTRKSFEYTFGAPQCDLGELAPNCILLYGMDFQFPLSFFSKSLNEDYSKAVQRLAFNDLRNHTWAFRVVEKLQKHFSGPLYVSMPLRAEKAVEANKALDFPMEHSSGPNQLADIYQFANSHFYNSVGLTYVPQPFDTINGDTLKTLFKYSQGSTRLAVGFDNDNEQHPPTDLNHMNADFGAKFLEQFLSFHV